MVKGFLGNGLASHKKVMNVVAKGKGSPLQKGDKRAPLNGKSIAKKAPIPSHAVAKSVNKVPTGKPVSTGNRNYVTHNGKMPGTV